MLNICLRLLADKKSNDRVVNTAAATVRQASCRHSHTAPCCMHACLPCFALVPETGLSAGSAATTAVCTFLHTAHAVHFSCWPCAGTALTVSAGLLACCSWPSWPALPTKATRLQAVALVFDHVLLAAPPSAEATRAASSPSEAGQEQVVSVPSSPASLQLSLSDRLSSLERARSTGSPRLGGAVNAALKLLEDLCMMATGQAPCSSSFC